MIYNLSIIRGHNYYTGTVFEGFLKDKKSLGAVGGGGRFENLCSYFSETKMPGVGMSVGVTRLYDLLMKEGYFDLSKTNETECAIITFDETLMDGLKITSALRENGVKADCLYENKSIKSKMKEANRRAIKYVLIVGEDEVKSQQYTLKNMQTSVQNKLTLEEIVKETSLKISSEYEAYIGKEYTNLERIDALIKIMENGQAQTVSQAIDLYKRQS